MSGSVAVAGERCRGEILLDVRGLRKEFPGRPAGVVAIDGLDMTLRRGEFVSLVGPSGCGKTTLLRCLAGLSAPTAGAIARAGKPMLVFQDYQRSLFHWKTVGDNIRFGLEHGKAPRPTWRLEDLLALFGLEPFEHFLPHELSGGMQQRVAIARALAYDAQSLLMDEPFGSLDAQTRGRLEDELLDIWAKFDKTVLFVTHDVDEAIYLSDRILVLSPRPCSILAEIEVDLPRPRECLKTREDAEFSRIRREISALLGRDAHA